MMGMGGYGVGLFFCARSKADIADDEKEVNDSDKEENDMNDKNLISGEEEANTRK